jgi:hypothetical protein
VRMVVTVEPMHDEGFTQRPIMGLTSQLFPEHRPLHSPRHETGPRSFDIVSVRGTAGRQTDTR